MNNNAENEDFDESIRMENELLRLQLLAESGAEPQSNAELDPELENMFLKNVLDFEHGYANSKRIKIYDLLEEPAFKKATELPDNLIEPALEEVTALLAAINIVVEFSGEYTDRVKYQFITEELFEQETDDFMLPGMTRYFNYEEFHPNHEQDIANRAEEFLEAWFKKNVPENSWELGDPFVLPDRTILRKSEVVAQINKIFAAYGDFTDSNYVIKGTGFQLNDDGTGLGNAEGIAKYNAVLENGETIQLEGPFKLYLTLEYGWWSIFHIVFPGFNYF